MGLACRVLPITCAGTDGAPAENYCASRVRRRVAANFGMMMQQGAGRSPTGGPCGSVAQRDCFASSSRCESKSL